MKVEMFARIIAFVALILTAMSMQCESKNQCESKPEQQGMDWLSLVEDYGRLAAKAKVCTV